MRERRAIGLMATEVAARVAPRIIELCTAFHTLLGSVIPHRSLAMWGWNIEAPATERLPPRCPQSLLPLFEGRLGSIPKPWRGS